MTTLAGVLPETAAAYDALDRYAQSQGISIAVANYGGVRTASDTTTILQYRVDDYNAALSKGAIRADTTLQQFRPIAPFGSSYHNYGAAFDVMIRARPSNLSVASALAALGAYAPSVGLRWGGRFTNPDPPHFELAVPLSDAQARYQSAQTLSVFDALPFDLSTFLPGLTPSNDEIETTRNIPPVYAAGDDAGDAVFDALPPENANTPLILMGLVIAGVMVWAVRQKLL